MEFGDKSRFSISLELDRNHDGVWLFGRICYWISGAMIGRYDVSTSLRDVLFQTGYILGDRGQRVCPTLFHLKKEKIFSLILTALDETSDKIYQYISEDFLPARFDIRIPVDVFDSWNIFLVEGGGEAKILYGEIESSEVFETTLIAGEFDRVFGEAHVYLERSYNAEIAREDDR